MQSGVIVAGGRSTRFGDADKAVAELAGTPMIRRVADRISTVVDELVVNCRPEQTGAIGEAMAGYPLAVTYAEDDVPDQGPAAGIRNGLEAAGGRYAFVVACDMPFVAPDLASYLFETVEGHEAAVPRPDSEWLQATQAVYHVEAMVTACADALEAGNRRVLDALAELDYVVVEASELETVAPLDTFENINTEQQFEAAQDRLAAAE